MTHQLLNERQVRALIYVFEDIFEITHRLVGMDQKNEMKPRQNGNLPEKSTVS